MKQIGLAMACGVCAAITAAVAVAVTRPATREVAPKLKANAPEAVRRVWSQRAQLKADRLRAVAADLQTEQTRLQRIQRAKTNPRLKGAVVHYPNSQKESYEFAKKEDKDKAVAEQQAKVNTIRAELDTIEASTLVAPVIGEQAQIKPGMIGYLHVTVKQVVDRNAAIVRVSAIKEWHLGGEMLIDLDDQRKDAWFTLDTTGMVDDEAQGKAMAVYITGTRTYTTALGGQRTILEGTLFDPAQFLE